MSDVHFSGSANAADRRRRRLLTEIDPEFDLSDATINSNQYECAADIAPFPMLSRDRLIRRVISPRMWKHVAVAVVLTLTPIVYAFVTWPSSSSSNIPDHALLASRLEALRGLSGLKLFAAGTSSRYLASPSAKSGESRASDTKTVKLDRCARPAS